MEAESKTVVITGASSGLGHAMVLEFAKKGYNVVLAARRKRALESVAREAQELGAQTLVVTTDVSEQKAMENLMSMAAERFGSVDLWVNNAGVTMYGKFEDAPMEAYRKVIETDLFGTVYGSRAAIQQFRRQGFGRLINISSMEATAPQPYSSAYVAAKSAVKSLGESLRMELMLDNLKEIYVTTIMPSSTDTPLYQNAANYTGRAVQAMNPVYDASYVAKQICRIAESPAPRREAVIGPAGKLQALEHKFMPRMFEWTEARLVETDKLKQEPAMVTDGNLHEPSRHTGISGGWRDSRMPARRFNMALGIGAAAFAVITTGLAAMWVTRQGRDHMEDMAEPMGEAAESMA